MSRLHRQLLLFLLGVLVPGAVLLAFGLMLVRQEGELEARRDADALSIRARALSDSLFATLEAEYRASDSLSTGPGRYLSGGLLLLGHYGDQGFESAWTPKDPHPLAARDYTSLTQQAQQAEFARGSRSEAIRIYRRRLAGETDSTRAADLQFRLARVLFSANRADEASGFAELAGRHGPDASDEYGSPIALYAAELFATQSDTTSACRTLVRTAASIDWLSPEATSYLAELDASLGCEVGDPLAARQREAALARMVSTLGARLIADQGAERWTTLSDAWLVRRVDGDRRAPERVVALPVASLPAFIAADSVRVASAAITMGSAERTLAPAFPNLRVQLQTPTDGFDRDRVYAVAVALVLLMTVFGGWLLWTDVRRETRLSNLRSQFVASVSHELRTPLTSIRLFAETMLEYGARDPAQQEKGLRVIAYESGRLTRMLNNVLNTTRIERGTMSYRREPGDLADAAENAIAAMQYPFDDAGVSIERDLQVAQASFDPDAMEQAVLNLLSNALKYAPGGRRVLVRTWEENGHAAVSVRDYGPGIASDDRERIFERFYRAQRETDLRTTGAGLGLALVQHIAQGHAGDVVLRSPSGQGAEFIVQIPRPE